MTHPERKEKLQSLVERWLTKDEIRAKFPQFTKQTIQYEILSRLLSLKQLTNELQFCIMPMEDDQGWKEVKKGDKVYHDITLDGLFNMRFLQQKSIIPGRITPPNGSSGSAVGRIRDALMDHLDSSTNATGEKSTNPLVVWLGKYDEKADLDTPALRTSTQPLTIFFRENPIPDTITLEYLQKLLLSCSDIRGKWLETIQMWIDAEKNGDFSQLEKINHNHAKLVLGGLDLLMREILNEVQKDANELVKNMPEWMQSLGSLNVRLVMDARRCKDAQSGVSIIPISSRPPSILRGMIFFLDDVEKAVVTLDGGNENQITNNKNIESWLKYFLGNHIKIEFKVLEESDMRKARSTRGDWQGSQYSSACMAKYGHTAVNDPQEKFMFETWLNKVKGIFLPLIEKKSVFFLSTNKRAFSSTRFMMERSKISRKRKAGPEMILLSILEGSEIQRIFFDNIPE